MYYRVPLGMRHQVSLSGETTREVRCAKCGAKYTYQMRRSGAGYATAWGFIGGGWARDRAAVKAEKNLERALRTGADPVPCPACGHYQSKMVWKIKLWWLVGTCAIAMVLFAFCWWLPANAPKRNQLWGVFMPGVVAAWCLLGFGVAVFVAYNPNYVPVRLFRKHVGKLMEGPRWRSDERGEALSRMIDAPVAAAMTAPVTAPARGRAVSPAPRVSLDPPSLGELSAADAGMEAEILDDASSDAGADDIELAKVGKMKVACSHCAAQFHAPIALEGRLIECGRCHRPFKLHRIGVEL